MNQAPATTERRPGNTELHCRLAVRGASGLTWEDWLSDVHVQAEPGAVLIVTGRCIDRSALFGLLAALRDANAELITLEQSPLQPKNQEQTS